MPRVPTWRVDPPVHELGGRFCLEWYHITSQSDWEIRYARYLHTPFPEF